MRYIRYNIIKQQLARINSCDDFNSLPWEDTCVTRRGNFLDVCSGNCDCTTTENVMPSVTTRWLELNPNYTWQCDNSIRYCVEKKQESFDNGKTFLDTIPLETRRGRLYDTGSQFCTSANKPQYKWLLSEQYECSGNTRVGYYEKKASFDNGKTWISIPYNKQDGTVYLEKRDAIIENSCDCGYYSLRYLFSDSYICGGDIPIEGFNSEQEYEIWEEWKYCPETDENIEKTGNIDYRNGVNRCKCGWREIKWLDSDPIIYECQDYYRYKIQEAWRYCPENGVLEGKTGQTKRIIDNEKRHIVDFGTLKESVPCVDIIVIDDGQGYTERDMYNDNCVVTGKERSDERFYDLCKYNPNAHTVTSANDGKPYYYNATTQDRVLNLKIYDNFDGDLLKEHNYVQKGIEPNKSYFFITTPYDGGNDNCFISTRTLGFNVEGGKTNDPNNNNSEIIDIYHKGQGYVILENSDTIKDFEPAFSYDNDPYEKIHLILNNSRTYTELNLSNFNVKEMVVEKREGMMVDFNDTTKSFTHLLSPAMEKLDLSNFNTKGIKYMNNWFDVYTTIESNYPKLKSLDLSTWDTSSVVNMSFMFKGLNSLTSLDLSSFNTSNVTNMCGMFQGCESLPSLDLSNFNTSNVDNVGYMFNGCKSLVELDLSNFNTSKFNNNVLTELFSRCDNLTTLNLNNWKLKPRYVGQLFYKSRKLKTIYLRNSDATTLDIINKELADEGLSNQVTVITN